MDPTPSVHRRSSDRLLGPFAFSPSPSAAVASAAEELNEAELFWDTESEPQNPAPPQPKSRFDRPVESGILVVLNDGDSRRSVFPSPSSSRMIPSLPRPPPPSSDYLVQSAPSRKFQQSAPVKVPIILSARRRNAAADDFDGALDDDDDEMLPPHELVARGSGVSPKTTFSVLEGVGRTLKGRDLRQVRNAVLRKTGFLD